MAKKRQKGLEYYFTKVSAPAPKRLIIESHVDGTYSITSTSGTTVALSDSSDSETAGDFDGDSDSGKRRISITVSIWREQSRNCKQN